MKEEIKMIFVSSTVPLKEIPTSKEKIYKSDGFLFSTMIKEKDYQKDNGLDGIYYKLCLYPYFYTFTFIGNNKSVFINLSIFITYLHSYIHRKSFQYTYHRVKLSIIISYFNFYTLNGK